MNQQQRNNVMNKVSALAQAHQAKIVKADLSKAQIIFEVDGRQCDVSLPTLYSRHFMVRWTGPAIDDESVFGQMGILKPANMERLLKTLGSQLETLEKAPTYH